MNQAQLLKKSWPLYSVMTINTCPMKKFYKLALGMIKQKYEQKKVYPRRPSLRKLRQCKLTTEEVTK